MVFAQPFAMNFHTKLTPNAANIQESKATTATYQQREPVHSRCGAIRVCVSRAQLGDDCE